MESYMNLAEKVGISPEIQCFDRRRTIEFSPIHVQVEYKDSAKSEFIVTLSVAKRRIIELHWIALLQAIRSIDALLENSHFEP